MITITRDRYEEMGFDELAGLIDNIHSYEEMLEIAIYEIQNRHVFLAIHILEAVGDLNYDKYYDYDVTMGTLETPTEVSTKEDLLDYIEFADEEEL